MFSDMSRVILLPLMLLFLSPPFIIPQDKILVVADLNLIKTLCHNSDSPDTCLKCVLSNKNAEGADSVGIAIILINCISNQGETLAANMTKLASLTSDEKAKPLCQRCAVEYGEIAKEEFVLATDLLRHHKYDNAEIFVVKARHMALTCYMELRLYHHRLTVPVPSEVFYYMKMYEEFSNSACRIIEKLYA